MKKKAWLIILTCAAALTSAAICWLASRNLSVHAGVCIAADNGQYLVMLDNSPVAMHQCREGKDLFEDLQTGDLIWIVHDGIQETYPGRTGVYYLIRVGDGTQIPEQVMESLWELGWMKKE